MPQTATQTRTFLQLVNDSVDPAIPSFLCSDFNMVLDRSLDQKVPMPLTPLVKAPLYSAHCLPTAASPTPGDIPIFAPLALRGTVLMVPYPPVSIILPARLVGATLSRPVTSFLAPTLITRLFSFKFPLHPFSLQAW